MIPDFDFQQVVLQTWQDDPQGTLLMILMGFFVCGACGVVGVFIILRRMALMGDAISHSLLPGIVLAFLITASRATLPMFAGAVVVGILTVIAVETIHRTSRVKADAAMGIIFSSFFAIGVILISLYSDQIDLDADCVLYGELVFVPFDDPVNLFGLNLGTVPVFRMGVVFVSLLALIFLFYKEILVTTFDAGLARSLGIPPRVYHYGLMVVLSLIIVGAFEAVGVILVVAMLIIPGSTALLLSHRLSRVIGWTIGLAFLYSLVGYHLDVWLNATMAGTMVSSALVIFMIVWIGSLAVRARQRKAVRGDSAGPLMSEEARIDSPAN